MDEHIRVDGRTVFSSIDVAEVNYDRQRNLVLWTDKHNVYSTREAVDVLMRRHSIGRVDTVARLRGNKTERKRWIKENVYSRGPLFVRPFLYFIYRFVFRLGFLDGKEGFIFHTLQAFWYRFLVDAKVYQIQKNAKLDGISIEDALRDHYQVDL